MHREKRNFFQMGIYFSFDITRINCVSSLSKGHIGSSAVFFCTVSPWRTKIKKLNEFGNLILGFN